MSRNVVNRACLKYPNHPRRSGLSSAMICCQAPAACPTGLLADLIPQPFQTLGTHVPPSPSKSVAQKVKAVASLAAIDNPGFLRMES